MSSLFAKLLKQAFVTFDRQNVSTFPTNFNVLKQMVDQLTVKDINLELDLISEETFSQPNKAPCTFVHIFQNDDVAMSVFILRGDYTMPLHDHPMMHGILKTLSGTLCIQSYSKIPGDRAVYVRGAHEIDVKPEPVKICTNSSESAILTPSERNYHEITAIGGVAAFFDILSPPYDSDMPIYGRRRCSFYRKQTQDDSNSNIKLERIPSPLSYYCDTGDYEPPEFLCEYEENHNT